MNSYLLGLNTIWLIGLTAFIWWRQRTPKSYKFEGGYTEPEIARHSPFTKKSGKRTPKTNDDVQAWKNENKIT